MKSWHIEQKPYNTGLGNMFEHKQRPKIVITNDTKTIKVTIEMTRAVEPEHAAMLSESMEKLVRGDLSLVLRIYEAAILKLYAVIDQFYPPKQK